MAIHPPMLYLGYVGFAVPFAFAMGSLITRQPGDGWIHTTRRWTLVTWLFQSTGVMLGAAWAYHVLGWGGYWGWDPVENASLLPVAQRHGVSAFGDDAGKEGHDEGLEHGADLGHLLPVHPRHVHDALRAWCNRCMRSRARISASTSSRFLAVGIAATIYLILDRLDYLKSEAQLESVVSRESSFLFNNLILLASCFAVLWGTLFPVISEAVSAKRISLDADWYNRLMVPIGLFLLFLTGVGPLFAWRRTSLDSLRRNFQWPGIASLVLVGALFAAGMRQFYALISFGFCLFVALTVMIEFYKGARSIAAKNQHEPAARHGGADAPQYAALRRLPGPHGDRADVHRLHRPRLQPERSEGTEHGRQHARGRLRAEDGGLEAGRERELPLASAPSCRFRRTATPLGTLEPEKRFYLASKQGTSEVGIRSRLNEDLYLNFGGMSDDNQRAVIQAYVFPLVSWIWIGGLVLIGGTLVCLVPSKIKMQYARTEVVGVMKKHATVQD